MNKRPIRDHAPKPRSLKPAVTGQLGGKERAPAGFVVLDEVRSASTDPIFILKQGRWYKIDKSARLEGFIWSARHKKWVVRPQVLDEAKEPTRPAQEPDENLNDPHLTLLSGSAFDAVAETLDNPPAPSAAAKQAVARARLWRR